MAADTGLFSGCVITDLDYQKIHRMPDGALVATSGSCSVGQEFRKWASGDRRGAFKPDSKEDNYSAILVAPDGKVSLFYKDATPIESDAEYYAIGAGYEMAFGAMGMGATAEEAVTACIKHHIYCAGHATTESLQQAPTPSKPSRS